MKRFVLALSVAALGCTSYRVETGGRPTIDPNSPPPGVATICVVRPHIAGALVPILVRDDGALVGATRGEGYFCYFAEPGHHEITTVGGDDIDDKLGTTNVDRATIDAVEGGRYFLVHDLGNIFGVAPLRWVDEPRGRAMIAECEWSTLTGVPGTEVLPGRTAPAIRAR